VSRPWANVLITPIAVLAIYFALPVDAEHAPVGVLAGVLISAAALAAVVMVLAAEARGARRLTGWHLVIALEIALVVFALTYYAIATNHPEQFVGLSTRIDALYFSTTTATTVGYGDIHAAGQAARVVVTLHMMFNLVFIAGVVNLARDWASERRMALKQARHEEPSQDS
jgi:voltage-gated potassium channel